MLEQVSYIFAIWRILTACARQSCATPACPNNHQWHGKHPCRSLPEGTRCDLQAMGRILYFFQPLSSPTSHSLSCLSCLLADSRYHQALQYHQCSSSAVRPLHQGQGDVIRHLFSYAEITGRYPPRLAGCLSKYLRAMVRKGVHHASFRSGHCKYWLNMAIEAGLICLAVFELLWRRSVLHPFCAGEPTSRYLSTSALARLASLSDRHQCGCSLLCATLERPLRTPCERASAFGSLPRCLTCDLFSSS